MDKKKIKVFLTSPMVGQFCDKVSKWHDNTILMLGDEFSTLIPMRGVSLDDYGRILPSEDGQDILRNNFDMLLNNADVVLANLAYSTVISVSSIMEVSVAYAVGKPVYIVESMACEYDPLYAAAYFKARTLEDAIEAIRKDWGGDAGREEFE